MDIRRILSRRLHILGLPMVLFGSAIIARVVHQLGMDADANRTAAGLTSLLGAVIFMVGIALCMGSCMLRDTQANFASGTLWQRPTFSLAANEGGSKGKSRGSPS